MHKSLGNAIEPQDIIKDRGAEILRLWSAMVNYQEDVRLSEEMLLRLSESYRKIRNTWRFMLGVLADFSPAARRRRRRLQRDRPLHPAAAAGGEGPGAPGLPGLRIPRHLPRPVQFLHRRPELLLPEFPEGQPLLQPPRRPAAPRQPAGRLHPAARDPAAHGPDPLLHLRGGLGLPPRLSRQGALHPPGALSRRSTKSSAAAVDGGALGKDHGPARPHAEGDRDGARRQAHRRFPGSRHRDHGDRGDDEKLLRENRELFKTILVIAALDVRAGKEEKITVRKASGRKCPRCWNWVADDAGRSPSIPSSARAAPPRRSRSNPVHLKNKKPYLFLIAWPSSPPTRRANGWWSSSCPWKAPATWSRAFSASGTCATPAPSGAFSPAMTAAWSPRSSPAWPSPPC